MPSLETLQLLGFTFPLVNAANRKEREMLEVVYSHYQLGVKYALTCDDAQVLRWWLSGLLGTRAGAGHPPKEEPTAQHQFKRAGVLRDEVFEWYPYRNDRNNFEFDREPNDSKFASNLAKDPSKPPFPKERWITLAKETLCRKDAKRVLPQVCHVLAVV